MFGAPTSFRTVIVGDAEAGKTSLIQTFLHQTFEPNQKPTVGAVFHTVTRILNNETVIMQIWDTAGQERYRSLMSLYYRGAQAVLLCATKETLNSIADWTSTVREAIDAPYIVLAITKCDLYEASELDVITRDAERLVSELSLGEFLFTSAKLQTGVAEAFTACAKAVNATSRSRMPHPAQTGSACC
jgi:small GTP-binding protein